MIKAIIYIGLGMLIYRFILSHPAVKQAAKNAANKLTSAAMSAGTPTNSKQS